MEKAVPKVLQYTTPSRSLNMREYSYCEHRRAPNLATKVTNFFFVSLEPQHGGPPVHQLAILTLVQGGKGDAPPHKKDIHFKDNFFHQVQNILVKKYGFSAEAASGITQNFLKRFRKCPENVGISLHDWRHMLWKKCLGESHLEISGEIYCQWLNLRYKYIAPSPEVTSLLETLGKSYCLALITNGPSNSQWEKIKRLRLSQYFDLILVSGDLEWEKPDKSIFLEACDHLGVSPEECIMVGDKLETDILGGIESGLGGTVWVPPLGSLGNLSSDDHDIVPDYVMKDVAELKFMLSSKVTSSDFQSNRIPRYLKGNNVDVDDGNSNGSDGS